MSDLDVLKEIPGYKAILKSVLKSQIQLLLEQLSDNTGEESIILTASVHDGSLSHLGSSTGKGFLEGRDEIKSQFLGYCLKSHHKQKTSESKASYQRTQPSPRIPPQPSPPVKRAKLPTPVALHRSSPYSRPSPRSSDTAIRLSQSDPVGIPTTDGGDINPIIIKQEVTESQGEDTETDAVASGNHGDSYSATPTSFPSSLSLSHTQTSEDQNRTVSSQEESEASDSRLESADNSIKIEPISENEMELEITGVEMGDNSSDNWAQGQMGYGSEGDTSYLNQSADQTRYKSNQTVTEAREGMALTSTIVAMAQGMKVVANQCCICGKVFGGKMDLSRHMMIHTGDKPFPCTVCHMRFRLRHHRDGHMIRKHPEEFKK